MTDKDLETKVNTIIKNQMDEITKTNAKAEEWLIDNIWSRESDDWKKVFKKRFGYWPDGRDIVDFINDYFDWFK